MKEKSIKKNMLMSIILTVSNFIFPLITYTYVARTLTPSGTGKVAFVQSIIAYFSYIASGGIPDYGRRECAKVRDDKKKLSHLVQELFFVNIILVTIAYISLIICVVMVSAFHQYKLLFSVMSISLILYSIGFEWVYQALEEYSYITSRSLILKIVSVVLTFLLIHSSDDYVWYGFLTIFTTSASYIFNFIHIRKYISFKKEGKYNLKQHIKPIAIFLSTYVVMTIYANFDVSMLGFISNEYEVGLYNAALKIKCILLSLSTSVTAVLVPRITFYLKEKKQDLANDLLCKSMRVSLLIAFPLSIYSLLFSKNLLIFVCGNDYIGANLALKVLMLCISPLILTNLFGNQILIPVGKEKRYSQSVFVGMFINLFLNIILIPYLGAFGATIGTLVTEIWNVFYMSSGVKEYRDYIFKKIKWVLYFIPLAIGSCLSVVVSIYIRSISVFWQLVITTICFFTPYYAILIAKKEPIISNFLTNLLRKVKK